MPFLGLIFFFVEISVLGDDYNHLIWLFVFLDLGTPFLIVHLPFLFKEAFINSRFCRFRIYQNDTQILTLYKFKDNQTFNWKYTAKIQPSTIPTLAGFGGDWQIDNQKLYLKFESEDVIAIADIDNDSIIFNQAFYENCKLNNQLLYQTD